MPPFDIRFRKDQAHSSGFGYDLRPNGIRPTSIIIHSTNGKAGSTFEDEAKFLLNSPKVSAHFLVGKEGQIAEILPLLKFRAFHAGEALHPFRNSASIGIENHHAVGEEWTVAQFDALTQLVRQLVQELAIGSALIERHRTVALPLGRKVDPSDWSDSDFVIWRDQLRETVTARTFRVITDQANVREGPGLRFPVALGGRAVVLRGHTFLADTLVQGDPLGGVRTWVHRADEIGFLHRSEVEEVA